LSLDRNALQNVFWQAMATDQVGLSVGDDLARRFAPGLPPIAAFADVVRPDFSALERHCASGEHLYVADWSGPAPPGWSIALEASMFRMMWQSPPPVVDDALRRRPLTPADGPAAYALAALTKPGPLGTRTLEMGEYLGVFDGGQLIAMAGERAHAGPWREVSGVCTHPDAQGRGLARRLMGALVARQLARGERPFLHVMCANDAAHRLYQRLGFVDVGQPIVRVVFRD
jgi:GNAT superfamily N-acetyltransferase